MTVVFPFFQGDVPKLRDLIAWIKQLGGARNHSALLVADPATQWSDCLSLLGLTRAIFRDADFVCTEREVAGWPQGSNALFRKAAEEMATRGQPFLWMEPDAIPLRSGWLNEIDAAYQRCERPFMGRIYGSTSHNTPPLMLSGIAVYPSDTIHRVGSLLNERAWDVSIANAIVPHAANTKLIQWFWGQPKLAPTFAYAKQHDSPINTLALANLEKDAVLFHRNKDGTLIRLLQNRLGITSAPADVVSLRRNGDIVALLPLLRWMALKKERNVRLVVHEEFMPLLESVSYVTGVPWQGDWEDPLAAAKILGGVNAQVFGKRLAPDMIRTNFAKVAWTQIGYNWNRHLPLVLDRRNPAREEALAQSVFKTDKPKVLVKLHSLSSPMGEAAFVLESIRREFGSSAEVVYLDEVKAQRVFDLVGLMDRAACLLTADTVTLWLCHASKVPSIQFTNGNGFSASPPRGNCLLRMPYTAAPSKWTSIADIVRRCLNQPAQTNDAVMVYSDFKPADPDTQRRQDRAWLTWPKLNARLFGYAGKRTSKSIGDPRAMPFVRDMVQAALSSGRESIVVITNNDILVGDGLREAIQKSCAKNGCFWCYRTPSHGAKTDQGADLFAFTRHWWNLHEHLFPDFLLGYWWWDDVMVRLMRWSGCMEQPRLYYHEPHPGVMVRNSSPGAHHNERLANAWLKEHDEFREKP